MVGIGEILDIILKHSGIKISYRNGNYADSLLNDDWFMPIFAQVQ